MVLQVEASVLWQKKRSVKLHFGSVLDRGAKGTDPDSRGEPPNWVSRLRVPGGATLVGSIIHGSLFFAFLLIKPGSRVNNPIIFEVFNLAFSKNSSSFIKNHIKNELFFVFSLIGSHPAVACPGNKLEQNTEFAGNPDRFRNRFFGELFPLILPQFYTRNFYFFLRSSGKILFSNSRLCRVSNLILKIEFTPRIWMQFDSSFVLRESKNNLQLVLCEQKVTLGHSHSVTLAINWTHFLLRNHGRHVK